MILIYEHHHNDPLLKDSPTMCDFSRGYTLFTLLPSTFGYSELVFLSTMELLIIIFAFALSIPSVPVGACISKTPLPEEVREKRSVPLSDYWSEPADPAHRAAVLGEENKAGCFAGKRASAATYLLIDDESKADHFRFKREAPSHKNHHQADD